MSITIRLMTLEDIPQSLELMREFSQESLNEYGFEIKPEQALELSKQFVDTSIVAIKDNKIIGILAGTIGIYPLDGSKVFQEIAWYVSKHHRIYGVTLLYRLDEFCKQWGVKHIIMAHMSNCKANKLDEFYTRLGYRELEVQYIKAVED
jgi:hypothetical protein